MADILVSVAFTVIKLDYYDNKIIDSICLLLDSLLVFKDPMTIKFVTPTSLSSHNSGDEFSSHNSGDVGKFFFLLGVFISILAMPHIGTLGTFDRRQESFINYMERLNCHFIAME